jgi:hypothetical protein
MMVREEVVMRTFKVEMEEGTMEEVGGEGVGREFSTGDLGVDQ